MSRIAQFRNSNNLNYSTEKQKKKIFGRVGECRNTRFSYCSLAPSFGDITNPNDVSDDTNTGGITPPVLGMGLWLKADNSTLLTLNDGDAINPWLDDSGSIPPNNATDQGTSTRRPTFKKNILNGLPGVQFDGTSDFLSTPVFASAYTQAETFILFKDLLDPPVDAFKSGFWGFTPDLDSTHMPFTSGSIYDNFASTVRRNTGNPTPDMTQPFLYNVTSTATEWTSRVNGVSFFTTATNTVSFGGGAYTVGMSFSGGSGNVYFNGYMFEFIIWPFKLTTQQRADMITYFNTKWGTSF